MAFFKRTKDARGRCFLARLRRDAAGNVFAMTAAAVIPMIGVVGGAIDASRMYLTRSRLQAACDSAVLAGRKAMTTSQFPANGVEEQRARAMFNFNYQDSDFQTTGTSFRATADANGRLTGTAQTSVPMTMMQIFGVRTQTTSLTCSADVQIPNIDIVFVLDVTGSMRCEPDGTNCNPGGGPDSKLVAMRTAAIRFFDTLQAQLNAAGANAGRVRYGFVPYSQTVNGRNLFVDNPNAGGDIGQLPLSNLVNAMDAESRVAYFDPTAANDKYIIDSDEPRITYDQVYDQSVPGTKEPYAGSNTAGTRMSNLDCNDYSQNYSMAITGGSPSNVTMFPRTSFPGNGVGDRILYIREGQSNATATKPTSGAFYWEITFSRVSGTWEDNNGADTSRYRACKRRVTRTKYIRQDFEFSHWTYQPVSYDVSNYKTQTGSLTFASNVNANFIAPGPGPYTPQQLATAADRNGLTISTVTWNGCLEERTTTPATTFNPIPAAARDLNVVAGGTDDNLRWRPVLEDVTYDRGQPAPEDSVTAYNPVGISCPGTSMQNLNVMNRAQFTNYVNSLTADGATYLDVGMVWGLRLIHPQGMFSARNLTGPNGGQISRHIIFLTDGILEPSAFSYSAYGVERMSQRVTKNTGQTQTTLHARRFQALCDVQRGAISIWAIGFGTSVTGNLTNCADPNRAFEADDATQLDAAFTAIARDIADLRLVQ